jgi:hypothetical protein
MNARHEWTTEKERTAALVNIVRETPRLLQLLQIVRDVGPPEAFVAAGAVRDTVWDVLTGRPPTESGGDVDVVYWARDEPEEAANVHEARLRTARPDVAWEVTNQATIHLWHWRARQVVVSPHGSVADGLATWPETATAVAVRLTSALTVDVLAPLGLADLFALRLRHNPALTSVDLFSKRVESKRWMQRWPELVLVSPSVR